MNLEEYRVVFMVASLALVLIVTAPTLSIVVPFLRGMERFSELWVLGPNHLAEDYPFNVWVGEQYRVFVGVRNHMGYSAYYTVYVKLRNQTQPFLYPQNSLPSPLPPLFEFRFLIRDGEKWEAALTVEFLEVSCLENTCLVRRMGINDMVFSVDSPSIWDSENNGFYYELFFELWLYNATSHGFQYHNRFVGIWLNVTGS